MRGKSQSILIYECFDSDEPSLKEAKLKNQKQYNLALAEFRNKNMPEQKSFSLNVKGIVQKIQFYSSISIDARSNWLDFFNSDTNKHRL